jgi:hypothetical protein
MSSTGYNDNTRLDPGGLERPGLDQSPHPARAADLARGESVIKYKSLLNVHKYTYDHSCY